LFDGFGNLAGGTISGFAQFFNGKNVFTGSGFNQSATQFLSWVNSNATFTALSTMLSGDDILVGSPFDDYIIGYGGNDQINAGQGYNIIDGSSGFDTISYADALVGVTVNLSLTTSQSTGCGTDTLFGIERIVGSAFNDILTGSSGSDELIGGTGNDQLSGGSGNDLIDGGFGNDVMLGGAGDDSIYDIMGGTFTVDGGSGIDFLLLHSTSTTGINFSLATAFASGSSALNIENFYLYGNSQADRITGASTADYIVGFNGDDVLTGLAGNDILDGGMGFDAALYSGVRRQYVANSTSVSGNGEGTDTLISIEEARFVDGVLTFDVDSASAQAMRLYDATLDRLPDQAGLEFQARALSSGSLTLVQLAANFVASPEFQARYGALSNQAFVEQLYRFCLNREGDAPGIAAQVNALNTGTSRAQLVVNFSESAEHRTLTQPTLNAGLWVPNDQALQIARLYDATFDRLPDVAGLTGQLAAYNAGTPLLTLAANFAASAEFQARYGALSNQQFVEQLYRFCLDREGDAPGIAAQVAALNAGTSRAQLLLNFSESAEHIALTAPSWSGGIRYVGFVGAPLEGVDGKYDAPQVLPGIDGPDLSLINKAHEAQVLPVGLDHDGAYDPADFGLTSLLDKAHDAFVLPATPDGGFQPWMPAVNDDLSPGDFGLDLFKALDLAPSHPDGPFHPDIALTLPSDPNTDDLSFGFHKGGNDLNWA
jgi:Ca2+-binding RTX toxin-like protein